jgi:hypothetical protein
MFKSRQQNKHPASEAEASEMMMMLGKARGCTQELSAGDWRPRNGDWLSQSLILSKVFAGHVA